MFDLDMSKMLLVAVVALVVVGPKELPQVLRALGKAVARFRSLQFSVKTAVIEFMREAGLDPSENGIAAIERAMRANIALNPATAMRGSLSPTFTTTAASGAAQIGASQFASPEMEAYLSLPHESTPAAQVWEAKGEHAVQRDEACDALPIRTVIALQPTNT